MRWPTWKQKRVTWQAVGYRPNGAQVPIHRSAARVVQVVGGERAGKSRVTAMEALARLPWCDRIGLVADEYDESRAEWQYIADGLATLGALGQTSTPRHGSWWGKSRTGCEFYTVSVRNGIDELTGTGKPFDLVLICEAGLVAYNVFTAARGRTAETRGAVLLSGTLWDNVGWYADLYRIGQRANEFDLQSFSLPSWANAALFPGGQEDPEIKAWRATLAEDDAARRIDAAVLASPARMYPEFVEPVHVQGWAEFDPEADVVLLVDAGYYPSRYTVLAVQFRRDRLGREMLVVVDEVWEWHKFHEEIIGMCQARPWWANVTQVVGGHETTQHQAAESTAEVWSAVARVYFETFDAGRILEGARRVRWLLKPPDGKGARLVLGPRCTGTAWEFQHYRRKTDHRGEVISEEPEDKNNDAMDALRTGVVWRFGLVDAPEQRRGLKLRSPYGGQG